MVTLFGEQQTPFKNLATQILVQTYVEKPTMTKCAAAIARAMDVNTNQHVQGSI
jgi:hypothetical protein